jgi:heme/copper-type cytochrome/quinol oxidase subunit 3
VSSGVTASFAHRAILRTDTRMIVLKALIGSVAYGVAFTLLQL